MPQYLLIAASVGGGEIFQGSVLFISLLLAPNQDCCCCFSGSVNLFWSHIGSGSCCGSSVAALWFTCSSQVLDGFGLCVFTLGSWYQRVMVAVTVLSAWELICMSEDVMQRYLIPKNFSCSSCTLQSAKLLFSAQKQGINRILFFSWSSLQLQWNEKVSVSHEVSARGYLSHGRYKRPY